jgi:hypothetical protein
MLCITSRFAAQSVKFPVRLCNTSPTTTLPDRRRHRCVQWNYCCDDDCEYRTLVVFALQADRQLKEGGGEGSVLCVFSSPFISHPRFPPLFHTHSRLLNNFCFPEFLPLFLFFAVEYYKR